MTTYAPLPIGGTWTSPVSHTPVLRGENRAERLVAVPGEASVLIGRGGADHLWGAWGANTFKYEKLSDSSGTNEDVIFNFDPGEDKIDVSKLLKKYRVKEVRIQDEPPEKIGDVQITHSPFGDSRLTIKVRPHGPDFSVRVDAMKLLPEHIDFFSRR